MVLFLFGVAATTALTARSLTSKASFRGSGVGPAMDGRGAISISSLDVGFTSTSRVGFTSTSSVFIFYSRALIAVR